jgi:hypothetical protein
VVSATRGGGGFVSFAFFDWLPTYSCEWRRRRRRRMWGE